MNQLLPIFDEVIADLSYVVTNPEEHNAIWIGKDIPTEFAVHAINIAKKQWNWLNYLDIINFPPNRIYIGGIVQPRLHLQKWLDQDFDSLQIDWPVEKFHQYIHQVNHAKDLLVDEA